MGASGLSPLALRLVMIFPLILSRRLGPSGASCRPCCKLHRCPALLWGEHVYLIKTPGVNSMVRWSPAPACFPHTRIEIELLEGLDHLRALTALLPHFPCHTSRVAITSPSFVSSSGAPRALALLPLHRRPRQPCPSRCLSHCFGDLHRILLPLPIQTQFESRRQHSHHPHRRFPGWRPRRH